MNNSTPVHRLHELGSSVVSDVLDVMGVKGVISGIAGAVIYRAARDTEEITKLRLQFSLEQ